MKRSLLLSAIVSTISLINIPVSAQTYHPYYITPSEQYIADQVCSYLNSGYSVSDTFKALMSGFRDYRHSITGYDQDLEADGREYDKVKSSLALSMETRKNCPRYHPRAYSFGVEVIRTVPKDLINMNDRSY